MNPSIAVILIEVTFTNPFGEHGKSSILFPAPDLIIYNPSTDNVLFFHRENNIAEHIGLLLQERRNPNVQTKDIGADTKNRLKKAHSVPNFFDLRDFRAR